MLLRYSIVEVVSYGVMTILIASALAHRNQARSLAKRLRVVVASLHHIVSRLREGEAAADGVSLAREAVDGLVLADVFHMAGRYQDFWVIKERVDQAIGAQFDPLFEACEQNELAGPRWGLMFTALGIVLTLAAAGREASGQGALDLSNVALAMVNTGLGLGVAIMERSTLAQYLTSLADELRAVLTMIVIEAGRPVEGRGYRSEATNEA
jgi:hypothetical protein